MDKELSANALQEHFTLPYAGVAPIPMSIPISSSSEGLQEQSLSEYEAPSTGLGLFTPEGLTADVEEERFIHEMQQKKKRSAKASGFNLCLNGA